MSEEETRTLEAIRKIREILREYDLWAAFTIVSVERAHWAYHFDPSWSCLDFDLETGRVHIKAKRADFATPEQHKRVVELTTGAIISTRDFAAKQFKEMEHLVSILDKQLKITHNYFDPRIDKT